MAERVTWIPPRAMSARSGNAPAVLRFGTDDFMTELTDALTSPTGLDGLQAAPETWRTSAPPAFPTPTPSSDSSTDTKLYQPVHGRFYLVAAHLVCRRVGEPDRRLDQSESIGFVVRRLVADHEYAWIAEPGGGRWTFVSDGFELEPGEELLPMAPTTHGHRGRTTQLYTGLVPVGARERYEARSLADATDPPGEEPSALALAVLDTVIAPLAEIAANFAVPEGEAEAEAAAEEARADAIEFAILDLVDWLDLSGTQIPGEFTVVSAVGASTWGDVINDVRVHRAGILAGDYESRARDVASDQAIATFLGVATPSAIGDPASTPLAQKLSEALDDAPPRSVAAVLDENAAPRLGGDDVRYVFRTVYRNSTCARPHAEWVSQPTEPFRFAAFFDPDAPARPVQIALPVDTSPRGLRQFPRNVSVLLSSQLRRQMSQINDEFDQVGGQTFSVGKLCVLSIPIITICALILLMIMVSILNIIFFWVPFFQVCLPMITPEPEDSS